ncbi:hypothetical protein FV226_13155 [Methylobacterium sp. WL12]|uniref:hypothetical protein n=1 Tax=Methylobacterium sp. WL12 TaxID=2603890 RepID=UPI0011CA9073|nr:hypothetical protein [Methylobacterium sp. WL12]TXM72171.1 hypothetical protein FV226_13155 [Methylobacterium sp. WL12]
MLSREWDSFVEACDLQHAPEIQRREMKRAFMAGARSYSGLVMRHASGGDEVTETDLAMMEALEVEMAAFLKDVMAGRA